MQGYLFVEHSIKVSNSFHEDFDKIISFVQNNKSCG